MTPEPSPRLVPPSDDASAPRKLGRGRSGTVYEERTDDGRRWASKVLVPDRASSLVMTVLTGAVNPYRWCRPAVDAAVLRRRLLEPLVQYWFGGAVRLPETRGVRWDDDAKAFALTAELIEGRHAMLRHPGCGAAKGEVRDLVRNVLQPLAKHLKRAGFDGLLWQAGKGNPVASANFMRETPPAGGPARWVWIDAESGVPALFPFNPWHLLATYLPLSLKHGRWLFDDVDVPCLRDYVDEHAAAFESSLGADRVTRMRRDVEALAAVQAKWKTLSRHQRSVGSHLAIGRITEEQAAHYAERPVRWLLRLVGKGAVKAARHAGRALLRGLAHLEPRRLATAVARWGKFFLSQRVRERWASRHVRLRVRDWRDRGFLTREDARAIRASMRTSDAGEYVADFGVHLAMKPGLKLITWGIVPLLQLTGYLDSWWIVGLLVVYGGAIGRTLYTFGRTLQALVRGRHLPVVALAVGLLPVVGNTAYPLQLLAASGTRDGGVAKFMVHDIFSAIGRRLPIWGGKDTLTEHRANAVATFVARG